MKTAPGSTPTADETSEPEVITEHERWVRCAVCDARIARQAAAMAVNGKHEHEFMNPSGIRFVISCWSAAPGCKPEGARSTVWTWFPGYAWQIEVCRMCHAHLGWSFHAATSFYGLIGKHLR